MTVEKAVEGLLCQDVYIALGAFVWGVGPTIQQAVKQAQLVGQPDYIKERYRGKFRVYRCSEGSWVNDLGSIVYPASSEAPLLVRDDFKSLLN